MKLFAKVLSLLTALLFISNSAQATGFYVGADVNHSFAMHQLQDKSPSPASNNGFKQDADATAYGANAGFRFDLPIVLAFAEAFYDKIGTSATDFESSPGQSKQQDRIDINDRYGAKLNVGLTVFPRTRLFVGYGLAKVNYNNHFYSTNQSLGKSEIAPIYSLGVLVDLIAGFSVRASYDHQVLKLRYDPASAQNNKTQLGTAKLGLMYRF